MKLRIMAADLSEKSKIQENLLTTFYKDSKNTQKILENIARNIHHPEQLSDILNPAKFSVNFNEG